MGIPVDGFKSEMIQKLKAKGFVPSELRRDVLEGEFNGHSVYVSVVTNNNKVCRIVLTDQNNMNETDIRIRFNSLCSQFKDNSKYVSFGDYTIPEDEDISYEMAVNNKRYEALFYQQLTVAPDSATVANEVQRIILNKYTEEELANPTEEMKSEILQMSFSYAADLMTKKTVWFMIGESYGKYFISMFYDNEYNRANGEDL